MRRLLIVLLLFSCVTGAAAQTATVRGFVTDAESETALQGATVVLERAGALLGEATDGDGFFTLRRVPIGSYTLRVSFVGYQTREETISVTAGELRDLSIALEPATGELEEALVVAEVESGIAAVAAGLETIRPSDVDRIPVPGVSGDLAAYLQTVPGVVLPGDRGGHFHVRGGAPDQNQVLLDGIPVYNPLHVLSMFSAFPEEVIDGADFYTGGYHAAYGERMSSVLDVTARNGNKQDFAGAAALAPFLSGLRLEGPLLTRRASFLLSGRRSLVEELTPDFFGQRMAYRFGDVFGKVHALLGRQHRLSITGLHTFDRGDLAATEKTFLGDALATPDTDSTRIAWTNTVFGARYEYFPGFMPAQFTLSGGLSSSTQEFGPAEQLERESSIESLDLKADLVYFLSGGEVALGGLFRATDTAYFMDGQFDDVPNRGSAALEEIAAYLSVEARAGLLTLTPGLRWYSVPDLSQSVFEPRLRVAASVADGHEVSASWGLFHQALIGLNDQRDLGNVFTAWMPVDGESLPQSMHAVLGWSGTLPAGVRLAVEGYFKDYADLRIPIFSAFPRFNTRLESADGQAYGADVRLEFTGQEFVRESQIGGRVSYSLGKVEYTTDSGAVFPPGHDRRHLAQGVITVSKGEVSLSVQAQYGSGLPFTPSAGFDKWYLFTPDVDVAWEAGEDRLLYAERNSARQPTYGRADVFIQRRIERGRYVGTLRAGALNVFNRSNLFYFDLYTYRRVDQLPVVPSVGMKLELR
ncbi:MAG: TonB-dependent receptor [Rhodothermales bacterium]|nr:TonB-dependent receptor [Rhodothermales bacterium]MBO6778312.1 TonB-dependent receptor [Rhodothermales bacterium]